MNEDLETRTLQDATTSFLAKAKERVRESNALERLAVYKGVAKENLDVHVQTAANDTYLQLLTNEKEPRGYALALEEGGRQRVLTRKEEKRLEHLAGLRVKTFGEEEAYKTLVSQLTITPVQETSKPPLYQRLRNGWAKRKERKKKKAEKSGPVITKGRVVKKPDFATLKARIAKATTKAVNADYGVVDDEEVKARLTGITKSHESFLDEEGAKNATAYDALRESLDNMERELSEGLNAFKNGLPPTGNEREEEREPYAKLEPATIQRTQTSVPRRATKPLLENLLVENKKGVDNEVRLEKERFVAELVNATYSARGSYEQALERTAEVLKEDVTRIEEELKSYVSHYGTEHRGKGVKLSFFNERLLSPEQKAVHEKLLSDAREGKGRRKVTATVLRDLHATISGLSPTIQDVPRDIVNLEEVVATYNESVRRFSVKDEEGNVKPEQERDKKAIYNLYVDGAQQLGLTRESYKDSLRAHVSRRLDVHKKTQLEGVESMLGRGTPLQRFDRTLLDDYQAYEREVAEKYQTSTKQSVADIAVELSVKYGMKVSTSSISRIARGYLASDAGDKMQYTSRREAIRAYEAGEAEKTVEAPEKREVAAGSTS